MKHWGMSENFVCFKVLYCCLENKNSITKVENWKPPSEPYKMWEFNDAAHVSFKISYGFEWTQSFQKAYWLRALEKLITLSEKSISWGIFLRQCSTTIISWQVKASPWRISRHFDFADLTVGYLMGRLSRSYRDSFLKSSLF